MILSIGSARLPRIDTFSGRGEHVVLLLLIDHRCFRGAFLPAALCRFIFVLLFDLFIYLLQLRAHDQFFAEALTSRIVIAVTGILTYFT